MPQPLLTAGFLPNLGMPEIIVILVIVLIIFGPKSLPQLGRALGKGLREFRTASSRLSDAIQEEDPEERAHGGASASQANAESARPPAPPPPANTVAATPSGTPPEHHS